MGDLYGLLFSMADGELLFGVWLQYHLLTIEGQLWYTCVFVYMYNGDYFKGAVWLICTNNVCTTHWTFRGLQWPLCVGGLIQVCDLYYFSPVSQCVCYKYL